ncbi:trace amine-associated receptor 1-like [Austrofundulus limnaeus]|uniref:Trace amine-associated receptor 1-like n=1 Tax=Austrofundulus limnaeus TaxID=52670 RepID=A0A2I4AV68_AUSLI|nr:PREDICTED: trace amine-associated receptor 1-like [Austrofundulus limnaeus]
MKTEPNVNMTDPFTALHPCYEINNFRYKFTTPPSAVCVMLYCFLTLLSVVTVCGNLLVIISVFYFKQLQTPTNYLVLSLAVADLLVGILVFPLTMAFCPSICMYHNNLFCNIRNSVDVYLCTCSVMHLCCISFDRYYAVCQPLTYKSKISHHLIFIMITLSWIVSLLLGIGVVIPKSEEKCQKTCIIDVFMTNTVGTILSFYLPLFIMLCIYLKIFFVAQRQARSIQTRMNRGATVSKMERKATKTLAIVLGVFIFCCTPCFLCITFIPFINNSVPVPVIETLVWLALTNSTLNPFIYAFFYSWFKSAFKIIMSGKILHRDFSNTKLQ